VPASSDNDVPDLQPAVGWMSDAISSDERDSARQGFKADVFVSVGAVILAAVVGGAAYIIGGRGALPLTLAVVATIYFVICLLTLHATGGGALPLKQYVARDGLFATAVHASGGALSGVVVVALSASLLIYKANSSKEQGENMIALDNATYWAIAGYRSGANDGTIQRIVSTATDATWTSADSASRATDPEVRSVVTLPGQHAVATIVSDRPLDKSEHVEARITDANGSDGTVVYYLIVRSVYSDLKSLTVAMGEPSITAMEDEPSKVRLMNALGARSNRISLNLPKDTVPPEPGEEVFVTLRESSHKFLPDSVKRLKPASALLARSN
jgi:hypothetical protein